MTENYSENRGSEKKRLVSRPTFCDRPHRLSIGR